MLLVHKNARILQFAEKANGEKNPIEEVLQSRGMNEGLVTWDQGHIGLLPEDVTQVYRHFIVLVPADMIESDGDLLLGSNTLSHILRIIWMR